MNDEQNEQPTQRRSRSKTIGKIISCALLLWLVSAYFLAPLVWQEYARHDPAFDNHPRITQTSDHHPGDPLNVALIGTKLELENIMKAAQWYPAAALGWKSDIDIATDTVLSRPDDDAPVSSLYLFGRKEDLAFEQPVGDNPRHRHHVRFWKSNEASDDGRPQWVGSAVYDERVGLSRTTGQITHVTAPEVDVERDYLFTCLEQTGELKRHFVVKGFHKQLTGRNGGGDPWRTDGDLYGGVIAEDAP
jgi:hypothetical protein